MAEGDRCNGEETVGGCGLPKGQGAVEGLRLEQRLGGEGVRQAGIWGKSFPDQGLAGSGVPRRGGAFNNALWSLRRSMFPSSWVDDA